MQIGEFFYKMCLIYFLLCSEGFIFTMLCDYVLTDRLPPGGFGVLRSHELLGVVRSVDCDCF